MLKLWYDQENLRVDVIWSKLKIRPNQGPIVKIFWHCFPYLQIQIFEDVETESH